MKGAYRSIITGLAVAALVLACKETTPVTPPAPAPEDPTPPKPTLVGTWEQVTEWEDDDGDVRPVTIKLVLTESGKAFWHVDQLELSGEERHEPYGHFANWKSTTDTITKTFVHDDDDDGQWESGTIDKSYHMSDSGSVLFVHHWESDEKEDRYERYTRVRDPVPSNPILLGTWESVGVYHEHDDLLDDYIVAGKETITLTFTKSRYILVETRRDGDEMVDYSHSSGTWTPAMEGSVTKTSVAERRRHDDGNWTIETRSFDKEYAWGAGGELFVIRWEDDPDEGETQNPYIERYTRVESPLPASMIGSWAGPRYENVEGTWTFTETWRFILRTDDTVTMEVVPEPEFAARPFPEADPYPPQCFHGTLTLDPSELFITFTNTTSNASNNVEVFENKTWRNAYAPTDRQDVIVMSTWWNEQLWPEQIAAEWPDNPRFPYGGYWLTLTREPSSDREPCQW